jgi:hypothetical protein
MGGTMERVVGSMAGVAWAKWVWMWDINLRWLGKKVMMTAFIIMFSPL